MTQTIPKAPTRTRPNPFKAYMGQEWDRLSPNIKHRFDHPSDQIHQAQFTGTMSQVFTNLCGRIMAWLSRPVQVLIPWSGDDITADFYFYQDAHGYHKIRTYHFPGRKPFRVASYVRLAQDGALYESVGMGLSLKLHAYAKYGSLCFISRGYYITLGTFKLRLPDFMTPGLCEVEHADLGPDKFYITIAMTHPWCGRKYYQCGEFHNAHAALEKEAA